MATKKPKSPSHLSAPTKRWYEQVTRDFELEPHHTRLLEMAAQSWDLYEAARKAISKNGLTIVDRYGQRKSAPEVDICRQAKISFARLIRELALDDAPPPPTRPPRTGGQRY